MTRAGPWRRALADARPERRLLVGSASLLLVGQLLSIAAPVLAGRALDAIVQGKDHELVVLLVLTGAVTAGSVVHAYIEQIVLGRLALVSLTRLRGRLMKHLLALDPDFASSRRSGWIVARLTSDVDNLQQFLESGLALAYRAILALTLTTATMLVLSARLTLTVVLVAVPLVLVSRWFRKRAFTAQLVVRESNARLLTRVSEAVSGMALVQAYVLEDEHRQLFEHENNDNYRSRMRTVQLLMVYYPLTELLQPVATAAVLALGLTLTAHGALQVGVVASFVLLLSRFFDPIQQFAEFHNLVQAAASSYQRVFDFLDERPRVTEAAEPLTLPAGGGALSLRSVVFRYSADGASVLDHVDLEVAAGTRLALVGESGAGKSTLAKLLARFHDPVEGVVLVDGVDVAKVPLHELRSSVALVMQEGFLFSGTVRDNIAMARPTATAAEVEQACHELGVLDALQRLPQGLDTEVGPNGVTLSAGQRQLVSLARALMADPRVLVLDEATANLDPATEVVVERAVRALMHGRTSVIIAHRVPSALRCDRVVVLANGRVIEDGSPEQLRRAGGTFARWVEQVSAGAAQQVGLAARPVEGSITS